MEWHHLYEIDRVVRLRPPNMPPSDLSRVHVVQIFKEEGLRSGIRIPELAFPINWSRTASGRVSTVPSRIIFNVLQWNALRRIRAGKDVVELLKRRRIFGINPRLRIHAYVRRDSEQPLGTRSATKRFEWVKQGVRTLLHPVLDLPVNPRFL